MLKESLRKRKDTQTIHVIGKIHDLMLGKVFVPKYSNLESPRVNIHIANKLITNDLIDLGATINALEMLELQGILRKPLIFIQMDNRSIVKQDRMISNSLNRLVGVYDRFHGLANKIKIRRLSFNSWKNLASNC